jgi:hypothetical protein
LTLLAATPAHPKANAVDLFNLNADIGLRAASNKSCLLPSLGRPGRALGQIMAGGRGGGHQVSSC